jgi:hypothetical protein
MVYNNKIFKLPKFNNQKWIKIWFTTLRGTKPQPQKISSFPLPFSHLLPTITLSFPPLSSFNPAFNTHSLSPSLSLSFHPLTQPPPSFCPFSSPPFLSYTTRSCPFSPFLPRFHLPVSVSARSPRGAVRPHPPANCTLATCLLSRRSSPSHLLDRCSIPLFKRSFSLPLTFLLVVCCLMCWE